MQLPARLRHAINLGGLTPWELVTRTYRAFIDNEVQTRAAGVAFYAMLALVPFIGLILFLAIQLLPDLTGHNNTATKIGNETVNQFKETLAQFLPSEATEEITNQIGRLQSQDPVSLLSFGLLVTIWLSSSIFVAVIDATNRIYGVYDRRSWIKVRLIAIAMTLTQAALLIGSLLTIVGWDYILAYLKLDASTSLLATIMQYVAIYFLILFSFALTYYISPDADQKWEWITPGSIVGAGLFLVSSLGFRIYVQNFANYNKTYGVLGGVMVLLFWFWISALVLLGAAQVNKIIEEASPIGKNYGQRTDSADAPDFAAMQPEESVAATSPAILTDAPDFAAMKPEDNLTQPEPVEL